MKNLSALTLCLGCVLTVSGSRAADLKQSKVTQVVNDVQIISAADQTKKSATVNDAFNMPDILRTGPSSRAELVAPDETVTRVGANTIFSFDPANRTIDLKQGSLLFHSPHGKGGGSIHTGSATASVLGSTLIVSTTASGGFKVLALEDEASIQFTNGLKQKLQPGQMTFILPGASQLAPVIIFRLDDLARGSQLVNGFNKPLPSLPIIHHNVDDQNKDIQSGKLDDTGLAVGDDADDKKVKVIDLNTLQSTLDQTFKDPTGFKAAINSDALINQPSITSPQVPTPPNHIFIDAPFALPGNFFFAEQTFKGFAARNITFNTIALQPLTVDLSSYSWMPEFDFVAADKLRISGSVRFGGLENSPGMILALIGGKQILVAAGTDIFADVANVEWRSSGALTFDSGSLNNSFDDDSFTLGGDFTAQNNEYFYIGGNLTVQTLGAITIDASTMNIGVQKTSSSGRFTAHDTVTLKNSIITADADNGSLEFTSTHGSVNVTGTSLQAKYLTINSGDGILLDGTSSAFSAGAGATANFTAANLVDLKNADFTQFAVMNISAPTVNLLNVKFDKFVNIFSDIGKWHNGFASGYVNDLGGNTWHGMALTAANGFSGTIPGTGVTIGQRP